MNSSKLYGFVFLLVALFAATTLARPGPGPLEDEDTRLNHTLHSTIDDLVSGDLNKKYEDAFKGFGGGTAAEKKKKQETSKNVFAEIFGTGQNAGQQIREAVGSIFSDNPNRRRTLRTTTTVPTTTTTEASVPK